MGSMATAAESSGPHAVCVPYPAQGHVIPMLNLAKLLHARGFRITYVNTHYNARRLLRSRGAAALAGVPGFRFAAIPDGLPDGDDDVTQDIPSLCRSTRDTCLPHLLRLIRELNDDDPPVTCLVADGVMSFALDAAKQLGLPSALLWTASACSFMAYRGYETLIQRGIIPFKDAGEMTAERLEAVVEGLPGLVKNIRLRDMPSFIRTTDADDLMVHFCIGETGRARAADAVILNTFPDLEAGAVAAMSGIIPGSVVPLGPLPVLAGDVIALAPEAAAIEVSLWKEDAGCLRWLDGKEPGTVVYVNFGSITVMTNEQLLEFAWGLAGTGFSFLWVVRPDLVAGDVAVLPPEWTAETSGRGMIARWCPQRAVLEHAAVGAFLTHSGWNSTLESVTAGVPMISWPFFADQQTNCRYSCTEWGTAMEIGGDVERSEVEGMIREVMVGEGKGKEMRAKAAEWKKKAGEAAVAAAGALDGLINDVLLRRGP